MGFISGEEKEGFFFLIDAILSGVGNSGVYCGGKKKRVKWRARIEVDMAYKTNNK